MKTSLEEVAAYYYQKGLAEGRTSAQKEIQEAKQEYESFVEAAQKGAQSQIEAVTAEKEAVVRSAKESYANGIQAGRDLMRRDIEQKILSLPIRKKEWFEDWRLWAEFLIKDLLKAIGCSVSPFLYLK